MSKSFLLLFFKKEDLPYAALSTFKLEIFMFNKLSFLAALMLDAHATFAASPPPPTITVGSLTLQYCNAEYDGYCGSITVPLDRSGTYPGTLTVGFEFYPRTNFAAPSAGLLLAQEGGPGYSTTGSRDGYVRMLAPLRTTRDILLMDKRGTGLSSAIDCPALQRAYLPTQKDVRACGHQLGSSAWFYESRDAADDLADLMGDLGYASADYYGDSYATWFGQVLAVLHPNLIRSMVLDSAYPTIGDHADTEVNNGQRAMDLVCQRSLPCRALGGTATARFAALLADLRAHPVSGLAPGANGELLRVTADPQGLFLLMANAGNTPVTWRNMDAAGRAWMEQRDSLPLLRLIAEARDSYSGGGAAEDFSVGLADAVICGEYGAPFDQTKSVTRREIQYARFVSLFESSAKQAFPPFLNADAINAQMDAEAYDVCITWPKPAIGRVPGQSFPPGSVFPAIPVLVLSGELDTVTAPQEGLATARLFPNSTFIETTNMVHESAIGDAGYFVPPNGQDLSDCIGPIVRNFLQSGGNPGDTGCVASIRPIRTVPLFAKKYADTPPAQNRAGNRTGEAGLVLAAAVAQTIGDTVAEYYSNTSGAGAGLRGGTFRIEHNAKGYTLVMQTMKWTNDLAVSGTILWNQLTGAIDATTSFTTTDGHAGTVAVSWNDRERDARATLSGSIDGAPLEAAMLAP
jgi:pimeloyl-ACP methyl ester carboxylesterase